MADSRRKEDAVRKSAQATAGAFLHLAKEYLEYKAEKLRPKTLYETKRYLIGIENAGPPVWRTLHSLTLPEITRTVIENRLETIKDESGSFTADRARAALSGFFAWAIKRRKTEINPVIGIEACHGLRRINA